MTDSAPQPTKSSSSTRTIIIVVVAVIILAGGGFVVYKLTNKKDAGTPAVVVAQKVRKAVVSGDQAVIDKNTTAQGKAELAPLKGKLGGVKFAQCGPAPFVTNGTKMCTFTQPGGQLSIFLTPSKKTWLVSSAKFGPVAVTPTAPPTT
jgi:hypothetical protein